MELLSGKIKKNKKKNKTFFLNKLELFSHVRNEGILLERSYRICYGAFVRLNDGVWTYFFLLREV